MSCFFLASCFSDEPAGKEVSIDGNEITERELDAVPSENGYYDREKIVVAGYADLTNDGINEKIVLDLSAAEETQEIILKIMNADGKTIWKESAGIPHAGWNSVYLCTVDGRNLLLRYNPYMNQGWGSYSYELFSIDSDGTESTVDKGEVSFDITGRTGEFDIEEMASFYNKINEYLDKSILLLSTEQGEPEYSTESRIVTRREDFPWLYGAGIEFDENDSIKDKLLKYRENMK
ncbi:hypothetical protein Cst_c03540 [Thermoclostridium stercorarium subsp. stercorarium DSM 8532]|jgi:hypothetical protein|uniref:Uncharacterized protein n=3 Tax=Thermoclostridium stercorarium TaxID=1510 RepID=L7VP98_THES1|nr:hypothetical protein Cst_c03540 [Thermoclostridium stercorarium subsp. stercorarium DSM 8532]AGI38439.1 hypothetical protein Clst_0336 [Thermoclostridium stercorarium subsp. stercorarium DSM 8532]ANW97870.1 hypothetical protein CSTERTH_01870 [Thermoclostridium stercorarium subsp. thermolacticum DSM 2910]ANX00423.1 hypothetical protein CSTERLE_01860 [Thermoclostridium stercorarium subsp. leptospartum DSM 9219]